MKLFRRKQIPAFATEEDIARRQKAIDEINKEIEEENFDKALETAVKLIEDCKGRDAFGEASGNHLAARSMILQGKDKMSMSNCEKAKAHIMKALDIYQLIEGEKKYRGEARIKGAYTLVILATLHQFAGEYDEAVETCQKSLSIFRRYGDHEGMKSANTVLFGAQLMRCNEEINETLTFPGPSKLKSAPVRCPKDGQRCPLPREDSLGRKKCPLYKCPLET